MGAWGPGLYQDDVAEDVITEYVNLLKIGKTNQEATEKLIEDNQMIINDFDDAPVFWFALADTQWKLGRLLPYVKDKALMYLTNEDDLKKWGNGNKANYKVRIKVLEELENRLNSPLPAIKKISIYKYFKCSWNVGDTYAFRLESEHAKTNNLFGHYLIINKIDEYHVRKGDDFDVFPVAYTKITKTTKLPETLDELINDCDFVRYVRCPGTGLFKYKTINDTNSSKIFKKLVFIGNFALERPKDEFIESDIGFPINTMKLIYYEEEKINAYLQLRNR
ncbi:MAG: hypothetical protein WC088_05100 [Candidatus Izemoplasmatales bacterium]|nr:hypothetical protein [Candidatus Izemoplasmatales bacterium]